MNNDVINLQRRKLYELMRHDFKAFLVGAFKETHGFEIKPNWHHEVICDALLSCYRGEDKRLIINVPPRSLKSFICNVAWPAWLMGQDPAIKIISVSYAQDLSNKFSRDQRSLMATEFYRSLFPKTKLNPKKQSESEFETTAGGFRLSTSTGGVLTGRGADVIIIDDPIKPQDALSEVARRNAINWIESTLMTRLNDQLRGIMVMIMQRLHEEDPTGHLLEKGTWNHLSFPAIAIEDEEWELSNGSVLTRKQGELLHPEREPEHILDNMKREMGNMHFSGQYQQQPVPTEGNIVKEKWFRYYTSLPETGHQQYIISLDSAMKDGANNDWSVFTVWSKYQRNYYLVDVIRKKMNFPDLHRCVKELANQYRPNHTLIEDVGSGTALIQQLRTQQIHTTPCKPIGDKVERFASASIAFERGQVFFPDNRPAWLDCLTHELLAFPGCKYDDQVDSVSQFLNWAMTSNIGTLTKIKIRGF